MHLHSVDDMTVIKEPEVRQSNCYQQEVEANTEDMKKVLDKVKELLGELEALQDIETEQVVSNIRMEFSELERAQRQLENNLKAVLKQHQQG